MLRGAVCNVYTDCNCYTYESRDGSFYNMELTADFEHYFGAVPLVEYINNTERQGDFEQLIPIMDAYNLLMSDRVNDKEQFVDSFLFLNNIEVDSEQQKKLRHEKILMAMDPDADAKYLSKVLSESDMKILRDDLKEDIHRFAMVPDMTDVNFSGNLSGVAIRYKLLTFEQHIKAKESYFTEGLKKRFALYNAVLEFRRLMAEVPVHRVDVIFTHNLPSNNYEVSQMINNLNTLVTQETLLAQLDFVGDPKEEAALAREEQAEKREDAAAARTKADYSVRYGKEE